MCQGRKVKDDLNAQVMLVVLLYAIQGIPAGFIENFLPIMLYANKQASLTGMGLVGVLCSPWLLKFLWAPFIDYYGTKKSWILPSLCVMVVCCGICAMQSTTDGIGLPLIAALLTFTTATAVEDCVVDGYAMTLIDAFRSSSSSRRILAIVNSAQVVGFKFGHFYAGAPVWYVHEAFGWWEIWAFMAVPIVLAGVLAYRTEEPQVKRDRTKSLSGALGTVSKHIKDRRTVMLMIAAGLIKGSEKVIMSMYKPYLVDSGYSASTVGEWVGLYGTVASAAGSIAASYIVGYMDAQGAVQLALLVRFVLVVISLVLPAGPAALAFQGLASGVITPVMFAYLMEAVSLSPYPVTSYTLLQTCDDLSRFAGVGVAGYLVELFGYGPVFAGAAISLILPCYVISGIDSDV